MKRPIETAEANSNVSRCTLQLGCLHHRQFLTSSIINMLIKDNQHKMNFGLILCCCRFYNTVRNIKLESVGCSWKPHETVDKKKKKKLYLLWVRTYDTLDCELSESFSFFCTKRVSPAWPCDVFDPLINPSGEESSTVYVCMPYHTLKSLLLLLNNSHKSKKFMQIIA